MSYYKEKRLANLKINEIVAALKLSKTEGFIPDIVLEITNLFDVGEKAVIDRLKLIAKTEESMVVDEDLIKWV